jgi:hypothetical protein
MQQLTECGEVTESATAFAEMAKLKARDLRLLNARTSPQMNLFALGSEYGQVLRQLRAAVAEPVWGFCVELGRVTGLQEEFRRPEHQANPSPQDVDPFISVVGLQALLTPVTCGNGVVEHLYRAFRARERDDGDAISHDRLAGDPRVCFLVAPHQIVKARSKAAGDRDEQLYRGPPLTGLKP